jgi:hypothetical protein
MMNQPRKREKRPSFRSVWLAFQESDRKFQESTAETNRKFQESIAETNRKFQELTAETNRKFQELTAETDRMIRKTNEAIGRLGNKLGELVESLMAAGLLDHFNDLGYVFTKASPRVAYFKAPKILGAEVDILLENGDYVLAVEVKTTLTIEYIQDHIKRLEFLRDYADKRQDRRKYQGAVAGGVISDQVRDYALKSGFYVIEPSGNTAVITPPDQVRTW